MTMRPILRVLGRLMPVLLAAACSATVARAQPAVFGFGVIGRAAAPSPDDAGLRDAIDASDADSLAFVVASGIKSAGEPCTDKLYFRRKEAFQGAKNGLIVSLSSSDWSGCRNTTGRSIAIDRLNRVRDLFFADEFSFGASRLPLVHQASMPKYRTFSENMRWDIGNVVFATVNLPANNNHYLPAAGRNSEFEDRVVADRDWLHRVFALASQKNAAGIVLFCDGNPLAERDLLSRIGFGGRDGFAEIRGKLTALAGQFRGRILLVHDGVTAAGPAVITWNGNLGSTSVGTAWIRITVDPARPQLFQASPGGPPLKTAHE